MNQKIYNITLLTPLLCHGARPREEAELRIPSIRGLLRLWHQILWGKQDADFCWGCVSQNSQKEGAAACASKVAMRLLENNLPTASEINMLPHHKMPVRAKGYGISERSFSVAVSFRYLPDNEKKQQLIEHVEKTIKLWLLLGTFGQRETRAFGSVWTKDFSSLSSDAYCDEVNSLLRGANQPYAVQLLEPAANDIKTATELLSCCSDTIGGKPDLFGGIRPRKVSPLKMKIVKLSGRYYVVLHASDHSIIENAMKVLHSNSKPLATKFNVIRKLGRQ